MNALADPHYQQLRQSFGTLEQRLAQTEQMIEAERQRQTAQEIEAFSNARDAAGRSRYPHFPRVRGVMAFLLRDDPALTLEAAYQKATEPLQQAVAEELRVRQEAADRVRQETVEKARKAAPVKSSGSSPNGSAKAKRPGCSALGQHQRKDCVRCLFALPNERRSFYRSNMRWLRPTHPSPIL